MTDDRIKKLNEIGFIWEVNTWNERFEELRQFYNTYGHFVVPAGKTFCCAVFLKITFRSCLRNVS